MKSEVKRLFSQAAIMLPKLHSRVGSLFESVALRRTLNIVVDGGKIAIGQDDVGVENKHVFPLGTLDTIVARLTGTAVILQVIMQIKDVCVLVANILARVFTPVLNNNNLEVLERLRAQALKQLVHFVGAIENRNDE